jgi:hypothetical protein
VPPQTESDGEGIVKGINFVTDDKGGNVAVTIDLKEYGELREDIYDRLLAASGQMSAVRVWTPLRSDL